MRSRFPGATIDFEPDDQRQSILDSWPAEVDVATARRDWGFDPEHDLAAAFDDYLVPAIRAVYQQEINDSLLLRALTYFDDADREAQLPGEGEKDWKRVKDFFLSRVGELLIPPMEPLEIQALRVDVSEE